jgi:hypothetical protein
MAFISGFFNISSSEVVKCNPGNPFFLSATIPGSESQAVWKTPRQGRSVLGLLGFIVFIAFVETGVGPSYLLDKALRALETDVISVAQILLHPALAISL